MQKTLFSDSMKHERTLFLFPYFRKYETNQTDSKGRTSEMRIFISRHSTSQMTLTSHDVKYGNLVCNEQKQQQWYRQ